MNNMNNTNNMEIQKTSGEESTLFRLLNSLDIISKALFLPIYCYQKRALIHSFPQKAANYPPPAFYLRDAAVLDTNTPYIPTSFQSTFGFLKINSIPDTFILIGPVAHLPYSEENLRRLSYDYQVPSSRRDSFAAYFQSIPCLLIQDFGNILRMINHFLGGFPEPDFSIASGVPSGTQIRSQSIVSTYEQKYHNETNDSLLYEHILTDIIEHGQIEKISELGSDFFSFSKGILANNPLRNLKNLTIVSIAVFCRAAIRAGVDSQLALKMSDLYIMNTEQSHNADEASDQVLNALTAYTVEVAKLRRSLEKDNSFGAVIRYVREHTHYPLSVSHIAAEFGYNSDYLSRAFKAELGFNLSAFIMRTKLEESKELLHHTNQSILEISEYLCFSSQNYFQTVFKKQYGITPLTYRRSCRDGK